jgi:hypothetical protein
LVGVPTTASGQQEPWDELTPTEIKELKTAITRYLASKAKPIFLPNPPAGMAWSNWCLKQYNAAAEAKNSPLLYQLIQAYIPVGERLMNAKEAEEKRIGLKIYFYSAGAAIDHLKDKSLAEAICEAHLLPNLHLAAEESGRFVSRDYVLSGVAYVYGKTENTQKLLKTHLTLLANSFAWGTANESDGYRVRVAVDLARLGRYGEALKYLEQIDPAGSLRGSRADLIRDYKAKLTESW